MLKNSAHLLNRAYRKLSESYYGAMNTSINIGCGSDIKPYWVNCDLDPIDTSVKKLDIRDVSDLTWLSNQSASLINCDHVIGYLTIAQAEHFFRSCYEGLKKGGILALEFPDLEKLMRKLAAFEYHSKESEENYIEVIRAIYAYDKEDAKSLIFSKTTYITGWTANYLAFKLREIGFTKITTLNPSTHGRLIERDSRVEATK
jgi:hypothetical protein